MNMFESYENLNSNYTPSNLSCNKPTTPCDNKLQPFKPTKPYEEYDAEGNLVGYFWYYGDTVTLQFTINGSFTIDSNSLIYSVQGQEPTSTTKGEINQKAYNVIDLKSWTCTAIRSDGYTVWTLDREFTYPETGRTNIYVTAEDFLKDKFVSFKLLNFRNDEVYKKVIPAQTNIEFSIDEKLATCLDRGVYYCLLNVFNKDGYNQTLLSPQDCTFIVK